MPLGRSVGSEGGLRDKRKLKICPVMTACQPGLHTAGQLPAGEATVSSVADKELSRITPGETKSG